MINLRKEKNIMVSTILLIVITTFLGGGITGLIVPRGDEATDISKDFISQALGDVIDEKIEPLEKKIDNIQYKLDDDIDFAVLLLDWEINQHSTPDSIIATMDFWIDNKWGIQLVAIDRILEKKDLRDELESRIIYPEVWQAFLLHAIRK